MHRILVMKRKCLQCHQQYLNISTPFQLLFKKYFSHRHHRNNLNLISPGLFTQHQLHSNFLFGINWNDLSQSRLSKPFGTCSSGIFCFNGCQVNINTNNSKQSQQNNNAKRKRHIIYSDSEESH